MDGADKEEATPTAEERADEAHEIATGYQRLYKETLEEARELRARVAELEAMRPGLTLEGALAHARVFLPELQRERDEARAELAKLTDVVATFMTDIGIVLDKPAAV